MVNKGARHIVLVSCSGSKAKVNEFLKETEAYTARTVMENCDVGDICDVKALIERITMEMPPIQGLIHSAMVLHVSYSAL